MNREQPRGWIITNLERSRVRFMEKGKSKPSWGRALDAGILFWPLTYKKEEAFKELTRYCEEFRLKIEEYRIEQFPADGKGKGK